MPLRPPSLHGELRQPVALVAGLSAALLCAALAIGAFVGGHPRQDPARAARIATDTFVSRLIAGNFDGAYDQLCADTRQRVERDDFVSSVGSRPAVRSYQIDGVEAVDTGFSVSLTLADPSGAAAPQVFRVVEDRGAWRVCGDPLPPA
jgi:hypothetical protein